LQIDLQAGDKRKLRLLGLHARKAQLNCVEIHSKAPQRA
jgi:hypothetical protein